MHLCAISFKECWQKDGVWYSYGGFPMQVRYIGIIFESMTLVITEVEPREGGIPLPEFSEIIPMKRPKGENASRKKFLIKNFGYYFKIINQNINKADVVYTPLPGDIPLIAFIISILKGKKLIARYGGSWENNAQTTAFGKITKYLMRHFAGGNRVMLATGMGNLPPAKKMHWIFSTVLTDDDVSKTKPILDRELVEVPELVYIGRLSSEKGVQVLLKAINIIRLKQPQLMFKLKLIGGGPQTDELKQLCEEYGIKDRVTFLGQLNKATLMAETSTADICVQPSLTEGFSKAWLDAFLSGLPIIASNVGAAEQVISNDKGWLVKPNDEQQLADTIVNCLTDKTINWTELRHNCFNFVKKLTIENWSNTIKSIADEQWKTY